MQDEEADSGERRLRIIVIVASLGVVLAMGGVRMCMKYGTPNTIADKDERGHGARSAQPSRSCEITSKPSGATLYAVRDEGAEALGVTPAEIDRGDFRVRIELAGFRPVEVELPAADPCAIHQTLELAPE